MEASPALSHLSKIRRSINCAFMMLVVSPRHTSLYIRKVRILSVPVLSNLTKGHPNRTGPNGQRVFPTSRVFHTLALHIGIDPHSRKLNEVHRPKPLVGNAEPWEREQQDSHSRAVQRNPVRHLSHSPTAMQIMIFDNDRGGLLEVRNIESHSVAK